MVITDMPPPKDAFEDILLPQEGRVSSLGGTRLVE